MTIAIFIIGSFATLAMVFAGVKALKSLEFQRQENLKIESLKKEVKEDFVTIKRSHLESIIKENQDLSTLMSHAILKYQRTEKDLGVFLNVEDNKYTKSNQESLLNYQESFNN